MHEHEELAFERLKLRYDLILGAAGEGIYGLDTDGRTTFVNAAATNILGWQEHELLGKVLHDIHHHSHEDGRAYPREACPIYAALQDGEVHHRVDEVFWHADGTAIPVEYTSTPIIEDGLIKGAVVVFRDISKRRQIEEQREQAFLQVKHLKEQLQLERDYLRDELNTQGNNGEIIGESFALKRTLAQIHAVAETTVSVLILGESGVGKEMIARTIHTNSRRADKALIKVNCASIPSELFESEFFGHIKGAFTGAHRNRVGRMHLANEGTLFLDEVAEIPLELQGKLLRALQEGEFERVGDDKTLHVDVRIIAATNKDLLQEIEAGRFREDLYYRLSVFPIEVPPLRERSEDIIALAQHFIQRSCKELGRNCYRLTKNNALRLKQHSWPGNIRELKNVIERAVILSSGESIRIDLALPNITSTPVSVSLDNGLTDRFEILTEEQIRQMEKNNIMRALQQCGGKVSGPTGAAQLLGLKPSTLSYRMSIFGIKKK